MPNIITRRQFLLATAAAGAGMTLPGCRRTYPNIVDNSAIAAIPPYERTEYTVVPPVATVRLSDYGDLKTAIAALPPNGGSVAIDMFFYIDEVIDVPPGVALVGTAALPGNNSDHGNMGGDHLQQNHLLVKRGVEPALNVHGGGSVFGLFLHKEGVIFGGNDASAFTDLAIKVSGEDVQIHGCFITGFEQGIYGTFVQRTRVYNNNIDCLNGIWLDRVFDIARIYGNHCWPWVTVSTGTQISSYRRGAAFRCSNGGDWNHFYGNFSFGYSWGYVLDSVEHVTMVQCGADGYGSFRHGTGFFITGSSKNITLLACQAGGQKIGFHNTTRRSDKPNQMLGCSHWSNDENIVGW